MPGMPKYPKDQGTEWMKLVRQVNNAFTSANRRIPYQKITAGVLNVSNVISILAGALLRFFYSTGATGLLMGRHSTGGGDPVDGMILRRADSSLVMWSFSSVADGSGFWGMYDKANHRIISDDTDNGVGLDRPWIPYTFANYTELTSPPAARQTAVTTDTNIVIAHTNAQHPRFRWAGYIQVPGGATAEVKVWNDQTGALLDSVTAGSGWQIRDAGLDDWDWASSAYIRFSIRRASGAGTVGFTLVSLMGAG